MNGDFETVKIMLWNRAQAARSPEARRAFTVAYIAVSQAMVNNCLMEGMVESIEYAVEEYETGRMQQEQES